MARKKKGNPVHGWLNIDKPKGLTSTQVIGRVRRLTQAQKLGHAGTLDPLATGILPIALGEATKTIPYVQDRDKVYHFTITWGEERNTDDAEGDVTATSQKRPTPAEIQAQIQRFVGNIMQTPPCFSAIKVDGERAYNLARSGEEVELQPRIVTVYGLRLLSPSPPARTCAWVGEGRGEGGGEASPQLADSVQSSLPPHPNPLPPLASRAGERGQMDTSEFEMECSKGTYVRSIARDMGRIMECYGYVSILRRLAVGSFTEENAISLDELEKIMQTSPPDQVLLPVETALDDIPVLAMTEAEVGRIRQGQSVRFISRQDMDRFSVAGVDDRTGVILAVGDNGPVALLEKDGVALHPVKVFNL